MQVLHLPAPKHKLIGHRGTAGLRPENTYCSFSHAAELGLNWIEFDTQLSQDRGWVILHDATLDRTTNGRGTVGEHTFADLIKLEAGSWFTPPFADQKLPSLLGTLHLANKLNLCCNIELKCEAKDADLYASEMIKFIQQYGELLSQAIFSSFDVQCLINLRESLPRLPISYLIDEFTEETIKICQKYNFHTINCDVGKIREEDLRAAQAAQLPVLLYTVNDPAIAQLWLNRGAYALFTDRPDLLLEKHVGDRATN